MKIFHFVSALLCVFVSTSTYAGSYVGKIESIQTKSNGYFFVFVDSNTECNSRVLRIADPNSLGANRIYSALLAYQAQNRNVQFSISNCESNIGIFSTIEDKNS